MFAHQTISKLILQTQEEYNKSNGLANLEESMTLLKLIDTKEDNKICLKQIKNQGAWKCKDCQKNKGSIYCNECWGNVRQYHAEHDYIYVNDYILGTCDCGNRNTFKDEKYICNKHRKNSEKWMKKDDSKRIIFMKIHERLFSKMADYISEQINYFSTNNELFKNNINDFIKYISQLAYNNIEVLNWISELLLNNYPITNKNANHICIRRYTSLNQKSSISSNFCYHYDTNELGKKKMKELYPYNCECPFLRYLMKVWQNKGYHNLLLRFAQNYELKVNIGILYLFSYDEFILNPFNDFSYLTKEFLSSKLREIISKKENENLIKKLLECPRIIIREYINPLFNKNISDEKPFKALKRIINNLKFDILYVLSEETKKYFIAKDAIFYCGLIDILASFQNINSIDSNTNKTQNEIKEAYNHYLLQTELSLLDIFTIITSIINFDEENLKKTIFDYFNQKIKNYKSLKSNEYSYHIPLFRGFSIFLNRFCFNYASKNNCDVMKGFEMVKDFMQNFEECIEISFAEVSKLFKFISACGENLFVYCGEKMNLYENTYNYTYKFVYRDFTLMRYLISNDSFNINLFQKYFKKEGSISQILLGFDSDTLQKNENINKNIDDNKKSKSHLLSILLNIIRSNGALIWNLGSSYKALKSCQVKDPLLKNVIEEDQESMKDLAKVLIINKAIVKENSASFSDLSNGIFYILREDMDIEEMVNKFFNYTVNNDQRNNYSLKDNFLNLFDTNYIISKKSKAKAERYLYDFKKNEISIFNRCFVNANKFEKDLSEKVYKNVLTENNINGILDTIIKLISDKKYYDLHPYFLNLLLNYIHIFLEINYENIINLREKLKETLNNFVEKISINDLNEIYKSYCDLIISKVKGNKMDIEQEKNIIKNNMIREKMKKLYKQKNKNIIDEEKNNDLMDIEITQITPIQKNIITCVYCNNPLRENDLKKCIGKMGYFLLDKYHHNSTFNVLKNTYNKYIGKNKSILNFKDIYEPKKENAKKNLRIFDCKHYIHFSCFCSNYMNSNIKIAINNFVCPVCKTYGNTFVPKINTFIHSLFKGFNFEFILKFRKKSFEKIFKERMDSINTQGDFFLLSSDMYKRIKYDNEKELNLIKNYQEIFDSCRHLIEGFFGIKENIYENFDLESKGFNSIQKDSLLYCFLQFRYFTEFITESNAESQLYLWKNLLLSFRLMLKANILKDNFFTNFNFFLYLMNNITSNDNISSMINNDQFNIILSGILFLICVFFEYDDIKGYEKYILYLFLPIYSFSYFFRSLYLKNSLSFFKGQNFFNNKNKNNITSFLNNMTEEVINSYLSSDEGINCLIFLLKKLTIVNYILKNEEYFQENVFEINNMYDKLNLSQLKKNNINQILDELSTLINLEKEEKNKILKTRDKTLYSIFFDFFKNETLYNHKNVIKFLIKKFHSEIMKDLCPRNINPNLLIFCEPLEYSFIPLPEKAVDFLFDNYNSQCQMCKTKGKGKDGFYCLFCGKKIICQKEIFAKENDENNFKFLLEHIDLCGGGNGVFLNSKNFRVIYLQQKKFSEIKIPLYLDQHGEPVKDNEINKYFKLNEIQLKKSIQLFTDNSIIFSRNYNPN